MRDNKGQSATVQLPISNKHGYPVFSDFLTELQRQFDVELNIKNNLYAFILKEGLFDKLCQYERTHDMTSPDGHGRAVLALSINSNEIKN